MVRERGDLGLPATLARAAWTNCAEQDAPWRHLPDECGVEMRLMGDPRMWAAEVRHRNISKEGVVPPEARLYWKLLGTVLLPLRLSLRWGFRSWKGRQDARRVRDLIRGDDNPG